VSQQELLQLLARLPDVGRLVKDRPYRQVWRFEFNPRVGLRDWFRRRLRGNPAMAEFQRLKMLQDAGVPAPRAIAMLVGFTIADVKGDAVILEGLEPSVQLDKYLNHMALEGKRVPNRPDLGRQMIAILRSLAKAGLGHEDLHLGNFLLKDGKVYLLDAYAVRKGGLRLEDLQFLAFAADAYVTRTELMRFWKELGNGNPRDLPVTNPRARGIWKNLLERVFRDDRYAGHLDGAGWTGHFFRHAKFPTRDNPASRLDVAQAEWEAAWPSLLARIEADELEIYKRTRSGDVLAGEVMLGAHVIPIVVKRPRRKYWYRYVNEIGRGSRALRAWVKSWQLIVRNIPTAWPLLLMERKTLGYTTDALVVLEKIEGRTLAKEDGRKDPQRYHLILRRCGRLLRRLERTGLYLYDSKAENWIVRDDAAHGPVPMIIDVDGIRRFRQRGGVHRLLRSLRQRADFDPSDATALVQGYAPYWRAEKQRALAGVDGEAAAGERVRVGG
jgi:tRNA A-37 threonylcarbamoyl transferase component Bud32